MSTTLFSEEIANTREEFMKLASNSCVLFYEVYVDNPCHELEVLFLKENAGESFVRFNLSKHLPEANKSFLELDNLTRRARNMPSQIVEMPTPYFASYVRPFGKCDIAWTAEEILKLILYTRKEAKIASPLLDLLDKK